MKDKEIKELERWIEEGEISKELANTETLETIKKKRSFHKFILDNKENLLKILQQPSDKKRKFRQSGHFVDQKLKTAIPEKQTTIFDILSTETKEKIHQHGVEMRTEGIRLTPPQDKLMTALMRLLHEKSETRNEKSPHFYSGNVETQIVPYGGQGKESKSATIRIYPSELYKAYLDSDDYSGADIKFIKSVLQDTEQQKFLLIYERKYQISTVKGTKKTITDRIEDFQSLFKIIRFYEGLTDEEKKELDQGNEELRERRGELIIAFNPILTDQINSKYVEYPEDINRRTMIAAGGHKLITESTIALRDYLLRDMSNKRKTTEINEEKLTIILKLENYLKEKRKKRVEQRITSSIQTVKNLGLITHHERIIGSSCQWKYIFHLNQDFL